MRREGRVYVFVWTLSAKTLIRDQKKPAVEMCACHIGSRVLGFGLFRGPAKNRFQVVALILGLSAGGPGTHTGGLT